MDFTPTEEQAAARDLAARIFGDLSTHERLTAAGTGSDAELWKALCEAGLPAAVEDIGLLGLVLLLEEQGRTTAQVPFAASCVYGLLAVSAHGSAEQRERLLPAIGDGTVVVTGALPEAAVWVGGSGELSGAVPVVPWLRDATHVLVADDEHGLWLVRTVDARCEPVELTAPWSAGRLTLDGTPGERLGERVGGSGAEVAGQEAYDDVLATARTAFAGLQAGVCAGSVARAVDHTNTREQFGRPLATKQGVQLRAADAYMDTEAIRVTAYEAAWRRDEGLDYATHALTAAWWASEAGQRVVHAGQHLHGGMGADLDHPVHRHFLWGRQLDAYLGCGSEVLQELGALIVHGEGDA
ncbi:alkylation response protein AidB-like acyl-CoA dehydrogenase [Streptomyces umbrinus]|uniref:Alkylation response protein AidB-like acyl-CoA dehydrogenase n=1 Tax=Streptomyces umbrinus TaxID=67370 RepID=A0ABU0SVY5_9ACTN|nr:acyl-CoA dehydrogenase family protein [Streptomyces umbrinus]MDQ1027638.1 alkylation response protein AidB-like acyl-CoA dehydrogenase [Streptomyces umbrinus]